ncbi:MAG TPA: CAP domain-containing protein [Candidatus Saccharibacteria bacterium]|jgi:hypothetical protein|nr:CAP domain-containing protein [Candidatus Saccharibacteria bacterium]HMT55245.1 CAP domain-containing protein [Candidatus Saccharibacteria bacterium]
MPKKIQSVKRPSTNHKKQQHPKHFLKVYWPYIPIILMVVFGMVFGNIRPILNTSKPATLAYATEMSISGLLKSTNEQRAAHGLSALTVNTKLNTSAQAKANDMIARDYWAHNTPDGDEPWVFFEAAGYAYQRAGENLAYGFSTSDATVIGWMNSSSHRANILDSSYTEVGFGFVNGENFNTTGKETVVVAHYATPLNVPAPALVATAEPTPAPSAPAVQQAQTTNESETSDESKENETKKSDEVANDAKDDEKANETLKPTESEQPINTDRPVPNATPSKNISRMQWITGGKAPWSALAVSAVSLVIVLLWLVKHAVLVKRFVLRGEHFVAHHPLLDLTVVAIASLAVYLSQSSGVVK